ncbi:MAG: hypothetical protein WCO78_01735 [Candidatus Roizmanbacteria bacterium]
MPQIIFTDHALKRLEERYFKKIMVEFTITSPDKVSPGKQASTMEYVKEFGPKKVTAIVGTARTGEPLVLSCWIDPPYEGTRDHAQQQRYAHYKKAGFWKRIWMDILKLIGL